MLVLPIKKKWFDMIVSGEKEEEYREIKQYWTSRFIKALGFPKSETENVQKLLARRWKTKDIEVMFRNGYSVDSPSLLAKVRLTIGYGNPEWGAEPKKEYYRLHIKDIEVLNGDSLVQKRR